MVLLVDPYGLGEPEAHRLQVQEKVRDLSTAAFGRRPVAPSAAAAVSELATGSGRAPVVPVDPATLAQSGEPFADADGVLAHYTHHPADGVGLVCGTHGASSVFAMEATGDAWSGLVREFAASGADAHGAVRYLDAAPHGLIRWSGRADPLRTFSARGAENIFAMGQLLRAPSVDPTLFRAWHVEGAVVVKSSTLRDGSIRVLGAGSVLPLHVGRNDGSVLQLVSPWRSVPVDALPAWLVGAVRGRVGG